MIPIDKDARRLSIVCYLRNNVWKRTKGKSIKFMQKHNKSLRSTDTIAKTNAQKSKNTNNRTRKT
jgi:hypothetical protein